MIAWFRKRFLRSTKPRRASRASHILGIHAAGRRRPVIEPLELRRLLTVTASASGGALSVQISGTDTALITEDADQDVLVEDSSGTVVFTGPPAGALTSISVTSTGTNDTTDLTQVGKSNDYVNLATIDIGPGTGAHVLLSGNFVTSGNQTYSAAVTLKGDTFVNSSSGSLDFANSIDGGFTLTSEAKTGVTFAGAIGSSAALTALFVNSGPLDLNASVVHTKIEQVYASAVTLTTNTKLISDTDAVDFGSTVDGAFSLTSSAASLTSFSGAVGASTRLTSLTTSGTGQTAISSNINTSGLQSYQQDVLLNRINQGDVIALSTQGGDVTFGGKVDSFADSGSPQFTLTVDTGGAGTTTFDGTVGAAIGLDNLTVTSGAIDLNGGSVQTSGTQTYNSPTVISVANTLTAGRSVLFESTLDGAAALTVAGAGGATFNGTAGGKTALASLSVTGTGITTLAANVATSGDQNYQQNVSLNANVVLNTQGGNIYFADNIDSLAGSGSPLFSLSIDTTAGGMTTFEGAIGTEVELASLTVAGGGIDLNGGSVVTSGAQTYSGPTAITIDTTLTSTASGNITFSQTLDSAEVPYALSVNTAGTTTFGGVVGGLGALATLTTDSAGTTAINGGSVTTTGAQTYIDAVTLGSPTTLLNSTGGAVISFAQKLDGASALTVSTSGLTFFGGPVGGTTPLAALAVNVGASRLSGPVSTTGNQTYQGPVTLLNNVTLTTRGGNVSFASTIDGFAVEGQVTAPVALTIDTTNGGTAPAGGLVALAGDIGDSVPLGTLTVTAAGPLDIAHRITTAGNQSFTVVPSSSVANGLTIAAGASLSSQGAVELRSGNNLTVAAGGTITATSITLRGDFNNPNPAAASVVLLAGNLQSPAVAVFTGDGNTTVDLLRTLANTSTIITGGAGMDTYNVSSVAPATNGVLTALAGGITINGGSGTNTLVLGDSADLPGRPGTLTANLVTGFGMAGISYSNLQNIVFRLSGGDAETLAILSTSPGSAVAVNGGQTVVVGGSPGGLDQIVSSLAINGASVLEINDQLSTTPHTYDISADFFLRTADGAVNTATINSAAVPGQVAVALANVKNITINGGSANNTYNVFLPLAPGQAVVIRGGGADNDVNVIGSTAGPNTAYVGAIGSGDPVQIGGVDCLTMYGAVNQPNTFVNQTTIRSILIGGLGNDTLVGGSGPDVLFGGGGNDLLVAGGTAGSPGTDYTFAALLPVYLANGMLNPNVGDATLYPGQPGTSIIDGGGGVVVYFFNGTQVFNASSVTMMECDLAGSRALLQNIFNQAIAGNECLATLTSPPARPGAVGTLATVANYGPYVERAYQDLLGRTADPTALSYWAAQLAGGLPRATFTNALTHSDEYYRRLISNDYQAYLGRVGDAAALNYWANQFEQGLSDQQFESLLLGSDEFYQRSGANNSAWINAVYQALLGRSADPQSEAAWNNQLQNGTSRQAIAYGIATSPEAFARVINTDYQQDLGRTPTAGEVSYWIGQFQNGASNENVVASFVASDEFFATS